MPTTTTAHPTTTATTAMPTTTTAHPTTTATTAAPTTTVASGSPQPVGDDPGPWNLVFDSEFSGSTLPSPWVTGAWGQPGITAGDSDLEQDCDDPAQVTVGGGALDINAIAEEETCGGTTQPYATGTVTTQGNFDFTYGYIEARIWLPGSGSIADWPAFWATSYNWPTTGEIDVFEGMGGQACATFHNSAGASGTCATGTYTGGWHTFAADWEPGSITYYYDGNAVYSDTSGITSAPMYLILDLALSTAMTSPDTAPATMQVAYVRIWQH
jgi:beta-glucanase (GH16 family)